MPDAEKAQCLVDHDPISDRISTDEPRLEDSELSSEARLWDLLRGCLTARATAIAADLGVAESLAAGPRSVAELAERARVDAGALHRILRALASDGVFAETEPGVFANTPSSDLLRGGWGSFAHLFGGVFYRAAGTLDASGESNFRRELGVDFWSWLAEHPGERAVFDRAMEQGKERRAARLATIEWRGDETVVDVGGGNGSFLRAVLQPGQRGIVLDLPETVRDDAELAAAGIEFVAGSFFEQVPPGDVYMLGTVLHDWDDQQATAILQTIGRHRDARILILDAVIPLGNDPHGAKWLDLLMLAISGRERTEPQWHVLVKAAGLKLVSVHDGLIEARCH